jgi:hypothetical protein
MGAERGRTERDSPTLGTTRLSAVARVLAVALTAVSVLVALAATVGAAQNPSDIKVLGGKQFNAYDYVESENGAYSLVQQDDGNLVWYYGGHIFGDGVSARWAAGTNGHPGAYARFQTDGNLVVYRSDGYPLWHSVTYMYPGAKLYLQDDGNLVIYDTAGVARWSSGTMSSQTPGFQGGDCWHNAVRKNCRYGYLNTQSSNVYFRAIDCYSSSSNCFGHVGAASGWDTSIRAAVGAWNSSPGPQWYSYAPHANDTWIYVYDNYSGEYYLSDGIVGTTFNCPYGGPCTIAGVATVAQWSEIHLNHSYLDSHPADVQWGAAHESGHGMMLAHNWGDPNAIMWYHTNGLGGPQSTDIGLLPPCASGGLGTRCVFGSSN